MKYAAVAAGIMAAFVLVGCDQAEIKEERARLELAEVKGDLDQMYLSLKKLADKGDSAARARLPGVEAPIRARETMIGAVNDRDHEQAVIAASELIRLNDKNKDAIKVLRESGQILYLLRKAQDAITAYRELEPGKTEAVSLDLSGIADPANRARQATLVAHAALRDIGLDVTDGKLSEKARRGDRRSPRRGPWRAGALVLRAVARAKNQAELAFVSARMLYATALDGLNDSASSRYGSVQETWSRISPLMKTAHEDIRVGPLAQLSREAKRVSSYRSGTMASAAETTARFAASVDAAVKRMMDPAGNLADYRAVGPTGRTEFDRFKSELAALVPDDVDDRARHSIDRLSAHKLFRHAGTEEILTRNASLFAL